MTFDLQNVKKDGHVVINSIFELRGGTFDINALIMECRSKNCTIRFENEDLTIKPFDDDDIVLRSKLHAYSSLIAYPKAAEDYFKYLCSLTPKR